MAGRYGSDQLNNALLLLAIVLMVIEWVMKWNWMSMFILALFILCYFRMFSRNIPARQKEYYSFLKVWTPVQKWFRIKKTAFRERKQYKYFRCPSCKAWLRLPRGKGVVTVTCSRCHTSFTQKS